LPLSGYEIMMTRSRATRFKLCVTPETDLSKLTVAEKDALILTLLPLVGQLEAALARARGTLNARSLTRGEGGAALQFEVELTSLDQLDQFRQSGVGSTEETGRWMHEFSQILLRPPEVTLLRLDAPA
jgi:hypothetical protein